VALGQVFPRVLRFPPTPSISIHRCSITRKNWKKLIIIIFFFFILITGLHNKPSRLQCVRSICCGALIHTNKPVPNILKLIQTYSRMVSTYYLVCSFLFIFSVWNCLVTSSNKISGQHFQIGHVHFLPSFTNTPSIQTGHVIKRRFICRYSPQNCTSTKARKNA
jgi:hypothetical protein